MISYFSMPAREEKHPMLDNAKSVTSLNIDIFRSILAQWVIVAHVAAVLLSLPLIPGRLAVWSFFIVSGYLNTQSLQGRASKTNWQEAVKGYYFGRIKRIYPLLIFSYLVVSAFLGSLLNNDILTLFPYKYFFKGELGNGGLWTLIIEIQLYFLTPLLFQLVHRIRGWNFYVLLFLCLLLIFYFPKLHVRIFHDPILLDDRTTFGNIGFYLLGMILAFRRDNLKAAKPWVTRLLWSIWVVYTVYFLYQYNFISPGVQFDRGQVVAILASYLVLTSNKALFSSGHRCFRFLGYYTYEIYLFHGLFIFIFHQLALKEEWYLVLLFAWVMPLLAVNLMHMANKMLPKLTRLKVIWRP